jgi:hypothetical protein
MTTGSMLSERQKMVLAVPTIIVGSALNFYYLTSHTASSTNQIRQTPETNHL